LKAEIQDWKSSRVTKYLLATKEAEYESLKEEWATGAFTREDSGSTNQLTAKALGEVNAIYDLINDIKDLGYDLEEEDEN